MRFPRSIASLRNIQPLLIDKAHSSGYESSTHFLSLDSHKRNNTLPLPKTLLISIAVPTVEDQ